MKHIVLLLSILSFHSFANDAHIFRFDYGRFMSPDGQQVLVCLPQHNINKLNQCVDINNKPAWIDGRRIPISGYSFSKYEISIFQAGFKYNSKQAIVKTNLLVHYRKRL